MQCENRPAIKKPVPAAIWLFRRADADPEMQSADRTMPAVNGARPPTSPILIQNEAPRIFLDAIIIDACHPQRDRDASAENIPAARSTL